MTSSGYNCAIRVVPCGIRNVGETLCWCCKAELLSCCRWLVMIDEMYNALFEMITKIEIRDVLFEMITEVEMRNVLFEMITKVESGLAPLYSYSLHLWHASATMSFLTRVEKDNVFCNHASNAY